MEKREEILVPEKHIPLDIVHVQMRLNLDQKMSTEKPVPPDK